MNFSLYIHIPWCLQKCPYCDFNAYSIKNHEPNYAAYTDALLKDLTEATLHFPWLATIDTIYFGGGTPSMMPPAQLTSIFKAINTYYKLAPNCEITMEISPVTSFDTLQEFIDHGINRFSIGIQSFADHTLQTLGREHSATHAFSVLEFLQKINFKNYNVDLIYGVKGQTTASILEDLNVALAAGCEHLSWYELMIEPNTVFFKKPHMKLPADDLEEIEERAAELLAIHHYKHYEVSAWCKNLQSQHNTNYWLFKDYLGIGAGSHSKITLPGKDILRYYKTRYPKDYIATRKVIIDRTSKPDLDYLLNRLRLFTDINYDEIACSLPKQHAEKIVQWAQNYPYPQLLYATEKCFRLTKQGQLLLNDVLNHYRSMK